MTLRIYCSLGLQLYSPCLTFVCFLAIKGKFSLLVESLKGSLNTIKPVILLPTLLIHVRHIGLQQGQLG